MLKDVVDISFDEMISIKYSSNMTGWLFLISAGVGVLSPPPGWSRSYSIRPGRARQTT